MVRIVNSIRAILFSFSPSIVSSINLGALARPPNINTYYQDGRLRCQRVDIGLAGELGNDLMATEEPTKATRRARSSQSWGLLSSLNDGQAYNSNSRLESALSDFDEHNEDDDDASVEDDDYLFDVENNHLKSADTNREQSSESRRNKRLVSRSRSNENGALSAAPLVCPQIDCKFEERIKLKNDCCTYCKNFDFCKLQATNNKWWPNQHLKCHANAYCINLNNINNLTLNDDDDEMKQAPTTRTSDLSSIDSRFKCHCKPGFIGDGHYCRDINECSERKLNRCDRKTTICVNLEGGYECRCKRGYRPTLAEEVGADSEKEEGPEPADSPTAAAQTIQNVTSVQMATGTPISANQHKSAPSATTRRSCVDINECSDGKLNRCHPQARCINLRGSYKCQCKRGYLGNGLECHKWFSSDPNVAAYLHRNSAANNNDTKAAESGLNPAARTKAHLIPLNTLNDPDDDQVDEATAVSVGQPTPSEQDDYHDEKEEEEDDDDDNNDDYLEDDNQERMPKLSEAKWEPLQANFLEKDSLHQLQQVSFDESFERGRCSSDINRKSLCCCGDQIKLPFEPASPAKRSPSVWGRAS